MTSLYFIRLDTSFFLNMRLINGRIVNTKIFAIKTMPTLLVYCLLDTLINLTTSYSICQQFNEDEDEIGSFSLSMSLISLRFFLV